MSADIAALPGRELSYLEPRRAVTLAAARRRSIYVRIVRAVLATAIVSIAGSIAFIVIRHASLAANEPGADAVENRSVRMINPRFTGRDTDGVPYLITADAALRRGDDDPRIELNAPALVFEDPDGPTLYVNAVSGDFTEEASALDLRGDVRFATANGYEFFTSTARIYLREGRVLGEDFVTGTGPLGAIQSQSFEIVDGGSRILFYENVVGLIDQESRPAAPLLDEEPQLGEGDVADESSAGGEEDG